MKKSVIAALAALTLVSCVGPPAYACDTPVVEASQRVLAASAAATPMVGGGRPTSN